MGWCVREYICVLDDMREDARAVCVCVCICHSPSHSISRPHILTDEYFTASEGEYDENGVLRPSLSHEKEVEVASTTKLHLEFDIDMVCVTWCKFASNSPLIETLTYLPFSLPSPSLLPPFSLPSPSLLPFSHPSSFSLCRSSLPLSLSSSFLPPSLSSSVFSSLSLPSLDQH